MPELVIFPLLLCELSFQLSLFVESILDLSSPWAAQPAVARTVRQTEHKTVDRCLLGMSFSVNPGFVS